MPASRADTIRTRSGTRRTARRRDGLHEHETDYTRRQGQARQGQAREGQARDEDGDGLGHEEETDEHGDSHAWTKTETDMDTDKDKKTDRKTEYGQAERTGDV